MKNLRSVPIFAVAFLALTPATGLAQALCADGSPVTAHLDWARGDTGHNEGAGCAVSIAGNLAGVSLPPGHEFLPYGEVFKRDAMMRVAREAYNKGYRQEAISVAICSQVHNGPIHDCLSNNSAAIEQWFMNWK